MSRFGPDIFLTGGRRGAWPGFAADVAWMRGRLRGAEAVCNMAQTRYEFAVGISAAMIEGVTTILPPSRAEKAVDAAVGDGRGTLVIGEAPGATARLIRLPALPAAPGRADPEELRAAIEAAEGEVHVFTSGSTGLPVRHVKLAGTLKGGGALTRDLVARAGLKGVRHALVGTTPHQHMYGLEATVFAALLHGKTVIDLPVFYPADLERAAVRAEAAGIEAIALITSPAHLRFLEEAALALPIVRAFISATAPLPAAAAERIEAAGVPVLEIYGSTEAGATAWRRTALDPRWTLAEGFTLTAGPWGHVASAPHLRGPQLLADELAVGPDGRFRLVGRRGDMVNIAGKRQSLGALNAVLADAPGVSDAVMLVERRAAGDELTALVVADPVAATDTRALKAALRHHLAEHFDRVFLPSRIVLVDRLPRSETGKISDAETRELAKRYAARG